MSSADKIDKNFKSASDAGSGHWKAGEYGVNTGLVHAGVLPDPVTGAILTPVYQSTTFVQESIDKYCAKGFSYTRSRNPTVNALEEKIAAVENGAGACAFSTGMAATCTIVSTFMSAGDHAVVTNCSYGGTNRAMRVLFSRFGMEFSFVDFTNLKEVEAAIKPNTKLLVSESPANPTLVLADLKALSDLAKSKNILHVSDSTFATPVICRPIDFGVDIVLQSTTKYYDGHNITVGGAVICATKENDEKIRFHQNVFGNAMSPQVAFYQLQTMKTMKLRVVQQSKTAHKIADFLLTHPKVETVRYPGLKCHPQKELADRQHFNGVHGGMLWFEVKGGTAAGRKLMDTVRKPWSLCENLGASESIITCPAVMTHANMLAEDRAKVGITDGFIRVSAGLEDEDDLISALKDALDAL
jgi:cystathionine gamma-lyase